MASWNQARILLAIFLLNFPLCTNRLFGNMSSYIYSLYYNWDNSAPRGMGPPWMYAVFVVSYSVTILPADVMKNKIGYRLTCALGTVLYSMGYFLTYFTVQTSAWTTAFTLMAMTGAGDGLITATSLVYVAGWFDEKVGLATSVALGSSGLAGIAMNPLSTAYINPNNSSPDLISDGISYFSQPQLLDRIPMVFVLLGILNTCILLPGLCLLKMPPVTCRPHKENSTKDNDNSPKKTHSTYYTTENAAPADEHRESRQLRSSKAESTGDACALQRRCCASDTYSDKTPLQVLKSETFYLVCFVSLTQAFGLEIVSTYFKLFGQIWISDDQFLAAIGSCFSVLTVILQMACGHFIDKIGLKNTIIIHLAAESIFMATWYFTAEPNKWLYFIWTNILWCLFHDQYLILSLSALKLFGETFYATNYGLFSSCSVIAVFGGSPAMMSILSSFGWFHLFFISSAMNFLILVFIALRLPNDREAARAVK